MGGLQKTARNWVPRMELSQGLAADMLSSERICDIALRTVSDSTWAETAAQGRLPRRFDQSSRWDKGRLTTGGRQIANLASAENWHVPTTS